MERGLTDLTDELDACNLRRCSLQRKLVKTVEYLSQMNDIDFTDWKRVQDLPELGKDPYYYHQRDWNGRMRFYIRSKPNTDPIPPGWRARTSEE